MKLLYIWMGEGATEYIQKEGLNLTVAHKFSVQTDGEKYKLTHEDTDSYDLWNDGNIIGLTALIGENGSGKTTLFRSIYTNNLLQDSELKEDAYLRFIEDQNRRHRCLLIYDVSEEKGIQIFHNLPSFSNETAYPAWNINTLDQESWLSVITQLEQQTKVYFTNSNYSDGFDGVNTHGALNGICLTPSSLDTISKLFFQKISMLLNSPYPSDRFSFLHSKLINCKNVLSFQEICDVSFLHSLKENDRKPLFEQKHPLQISFTDPLRMLRGLTGYQNLGSEKIKSDVAEEKALSDCAESYLKMLRQAERELDTLSRLFSVMMFEICYVCGFPFPKQLPTTADNWKLELYARISEYKRRNHNESIAAYYQNGLEEAKTLYQILCDCPRQDNYLPPSDLGYVKTVAVEPNTEPYYRFCEAIDKFAQAKSSVVLKYISISGLTCSSGERALLNLFSWLRLPPLYDKFLSADSIALRDDVLLMIDELDLYMHPEWQRKAMLELKTWLEDLYPGKKIQLLIATHSPLVLSDIPKENCYFLKPNKWLLFVDLQEITQTFGANIHQILNNSFFLEKTKGEFSFELINRIAENLEALKKQKQDEAKAEPQNSDAVSVLQERCRGYRKVIELIGEPLIRQKLWTYYLDCFPEEASIEDRLQRKIQAMTVEQKEQLWPELIRFLEKIGEP